MRFLFQILLVTAISHGIALAGQSPEKVSDDVLIRENRVGQAKIGMAVDDLQQMYPGLRLVDLQTEGMFTPALALFISGRAKAALTFEIGKSEDNRWTLSRIAVTDARFQTISGIRIGATFRALRQRYPDILNEGSGEGVTAWADESSGISFLFSAVEAGQPLRQDKTIESILVFRGKTSHR